MDYRKLMKSRKLRLKILQMLEWFPDAPMVRIQYRIQTGRRLSLSRPQRYTEKLQWYKLYYRDEKMQKCSDKYEVRNYVKQKGLERILNTCYGVYDSFEEIDFACFPKSFVLKDTLGSGGNSIIICRDKTQIDLNDIKKRVSEWLHVPSGFSGGGREWVYKGKHRIIAEEYLEDEKGDLPDYKFFCFRGKVFCLYTLSGNFGTPNSGKCAFFSPDYQLLHVTREDYPVQQEQLPMPENFEEMIACCKKLSSDFPHVRVDLYNIKGKLVFGELTFFNGSGYCRFVPDSFDYELGDAFVLPERNC